MSTEVIPQKTEEAKESFSYASHPKPLQARYFIINFCWELLIILKI